jgi:hypothetical protein
LGGYLPNAPTKPEEIVKLHPPAVRQPLVEFNLPGMGGVFNPINLALYSYAAQNPLKYVDPDGKADDVPDGMKIKVDLSLPDNGVWMFGQNVTIGPHQITNPTFYSDYGDSGDTLTIKPSVGGGSWSLTFDFHKPHMMTVTSETNDVTGQSGQVPAPSFGSLAPPKTQGIKSIGDLRSWINWGRNVNATHAPNPMSGRQTGQVEGPGTYDILFSLSGNGQKKTMMVTFSLPLGD